MKFWLGGSSMNSGKASYLVSRGIVNICFFLALFPIPMKASDCRTFLAPYFQWIEQRPGQRDGDHVVGAKMASVKIREMGAATYPWGHGSYAEGRLGWHGGDLTGRFMVLFSDRKSPDGKYRFDPKQADIQDVSVFRDGRVRVVLRSWGNASFFLDSITCYGDGFITGIKREDNGTSMVTLLLRKEVIVTGKDGLRDWP